MKTVKIAYWASTILLSLLILMSATMYFMKNDEVQITFKALAYPVFIIYPLAIAKILGVIAILSNLSRRLKSLAYAGFFFNFLLAFHAHIMVKDQEFIPALVALVLLGVSYYSNNILDKPHSDH